MGVIAELKIPAEFDQYMFEIVGMFPDHVKHDKETHTTEFTKPLSFEIKVTLSYVSFVTEFCSVTDSLDIVLSDILALTKYPPIRPKEGESRYFLLTRVFFYELLRIKDAFPRFLKRMEEEGLMTREDRHATKKMIEKWMQEHYLIRNTYLHGRSMPINDQEFDLSLMRSAHENGYQPTLTPLDGSEAKKYPDHLVDLANKRYELLLDLANEYVRFFQTILNTTATWVAQKKFRQNIA